jgi:hypothetical protein
MQNEWAREKLKPGFDGDSNAYEKFNYHLAKVGTAGLFLYLPMVTAMVSYHNTMTQSSITASDYYETCLPVPERFSSFETCAADTSGDEVVTLGPSASDEAAMALAVIQIIVSLGYTYTWGHQTLHGARCTTDLWLFAAAIGSHAFAGLKLAHTCDLITCLLVVHF